eukprot:jgi/Orpsp1_1/1183492/evm.model.c7180000085439.1
MKISIIYSIYILKLLFYSAYGISLDCKKLNKFLKRPENTDCCQFTKENGCQNDNYEIQELIFDSTELNFNLNFQNIPVFNKLKKLIIKSMNIKTIKLDINLNSSIERINLSRNLLEVFPTQLLKLPNLKYLDLSMNNINKLELNFLNYLPKLKRLYLNYNEINEIIINDSILNSSLSSLNLSDNNITQFPSQLFNLKNIRNIYLDDNYIKEITDDINKNSNIEIIDLSNNKIEKFPIIFKYLPKLKRLNLYKNKISQTNLDISVFSSLEELDIGFNNFDGDLKFSRKMKEIIINYNLFSSLTIENEEKFPQLETLESFENNLNNNVFDTITKLNNLKYLFIGGNKKIDSFPQAISNLNNLKGLHMMNISITEFPSNIFKLSNLDFINAGDNPQLNVKLINFGNQIPECYFENVNISCYQSKTCKKIKNIKNITKKLCSEKDIKEILDSQIEIKNEDIEENKKIEENKRNSFRIKEILIIIVIIVIVTIILSLLYYIINKNKNKDENENIIQENFNDQNIVVSKSILVIPKMPKKKKKLYDEISSIEYENLIKKKKDILNYPDDKKYIY